MFRQLTELEQGLMTRPPPCGSMVNGHPFLSTLRMYLRRPAALAEATDLYEHRIRLLNGDELDLEMFRGYPALIVNTASKCGFTPQYAGLQSLHERYGDRGLRLLGSPSADFAGQEYGDAQDIGAFCRRNYGVSFALTERMSVRADPSPLWSDLARQPNSGPPVWNFTKYLVDRDGKVLARFDAPIDPMSKELTAAVEAALKSK